MVIICQLIDRFRFDDVCIRDRLLTALYFPISMATKPVISYFFKYFGVVFNFLFQKGKTAAVTILRALAIKLSFLKNSK